MKITAEIVVIVIGLVFLFLTSELKGLKKNISFVLAIFLILSQGYLLYQKSRLEHISAKSGKIKTEGTSNTKLKLYYGTNFYTTTASFLTDEVLNNFIYPWPKMDSYIRKENGKLLVDIIVRGQDTAILAKLKNNEWIVSNDIFDRNYDDTKLEVFDKYEEVPILQIMLFEDVVILNGVFYKENGMKHVATTKGLTINPTKPLKNLIVPWFKYPSSEHPGESIEKSVQESINDLKLLLNKYKIE